MTTQPGWQPLLDAIDSATDAGTRHALEIVARHVVAEVAGDLDDLMSTLVSDPVYTIWGASSSTGPVGTAAVRRHYEDMIATGKNRLDYALTRVVADPRAVVTEGVFHHVYDGASLAGRVSLPDGGTPEPGHWYHVAYQALVVWPVSDDGLLLGEEIYAGEPPRVVGEISPDEMPHLGPVNRSAVRPASHHRPARRGVR